MLMKQKLKYTEGRQNLELSCKCDVLTKQNMLRLLALFMQHLSHFCILFIAEWLKKYDNDFDTSDEVIVVTWRQNNPLTGLWGLWIAGRWRKYTCKHVLVGNYDGSGENYHDVGQFQMAMIMKLTMTMSMRMKIRVMSMSLTSSAFSPQGETQEPFPLLSPGGGSMLETDLTTWPFHSRHHHVVSHHRRYHH